MHQRDFGFAMSIGDASDRSGVKFMQVINDQLYAIKEASIWRIQLADEIDPERTNTRIPNVQQRVASCGTSSKVVSRTLIQAIELTKNRSWGLPVSVDGVLISALRAAQAGSLIDNNIVRLEEHASVTKKELSELTSMKNFALPSYPELDNLWASSLYAISAFRSAIRDLVVSIFPENEMGANWLSDLKRRVDFKPARFFDNEKAFSNIEHDMKLVREFRNIEQHPKANRYVNLSDYWMRQDGQIGAPCLHIVGLDKDEILTEISDFLGQMRDCLTFAYEMILLWSVSTAINPFLGQKPIIIHNENCEETPNCRYSLAIEFDGKTSVLG